MAWAQPFWCATRWTERRPSSWPLAWWCCSVDYLGKFACRGIDSLYLCILLYRKDYESTKITRLAQLILKQINKPVSANHKPAQWFKKDWSWITDKRHNRQPKAQNWEIHPWLHIQLLMKYTENKSVKFSFMLSVPCIMRKDHQLYRKLILFDFW